jgi:hypothetical protein
MAAFRLFQTQMVGSPARLCAGISLDVVKVFLSLFPTGADQRCTKENHKILLQFILQKLYNL